VTTTGTVHYGRKLKPNASGYQHIIPVCGNGNFRYSLTEVPADTEVTCKRCAAR